MRTVSCNNFRVSARTEPVAGLSVEVVQSGRESPVQLYDGSKCTDQIHVLEHVQIANPATTDSDGAITVCVVPGFYDIVISGAGAETKRHKLDERGKVVEEPG